MAIVVVHTSVPTGPKHWPLSDGAFRLWFAGLCWSKENLTDGYIPENMLPVLHRDALKLVKELTTPQVRGKSPLWEGTEGGYQMHDYEDWQDVKSDVQSTRKRWRQNKRKQRAKKAEAAKNPAKTPKKKG